MSPTPGRSYGLLTIRLDNPPATEKEIFAEIKSVLGISAPRLDEEMGIMWGAAPSRIAGEYVIGVELGTLRALEKSGHPNVVGCRHAMAYSEHRKPLDLKQPMVEYLLVEVNAPQGKSAADTFDSVKKNLNLSHPDISDHYGFIPMGGTPTGVVMIEKNAAEKLKAEMHPDVVKVYPNTKIEPFGGPSKGCKPKP